MLSEIRANRLANLMKKSFKLGLSRSGKQSLKSSKGLAGPDEAPKGQHHGGGSHTYLRKQAHVMCQHMHEHTAQEKTGGTRSLCAVTKQVIWITELWRTDRQTKMDATRLFMKDWP